MGLETLNCIALSQLVR